MKTIKAITNLFKYIRKPQTKRKGIWIRTNPMTSQMLTKIFKIDLVLNINININ